MPEVRWKISLKVRVGYELLVCLMDLNSLVSHLVRAEETGSVLNKWLKQNLSL